MKVVARDRPMMRASSSGKLKEQLLRVKGPEAVNDLKAMFADTPVVLIAGQQCTGKGTVAPLVAKALAGEDARVKGTGKLMREAAQQAGKSVEDFVRSVPPDFDVELDFKAAQLIAKGDVDVFESRLAGHLGSFLRGLGRKNLVSVYLVATPKEQALRYVAREVSPAARARIEAKLEVKKGASIADALKAIVAVGDAEVTRKIAPLVDEIAARDDVDRARLLKLYGLDYQDQNAFDVVVDTTNKTPDEVRAAVMDALGARGLVPRRR